jgi:CBS domain-containing protein
MSEQSAVSAARSADSPDLRTVGQVMRPTATVEPYAHLAAAMYLIRHSHDPALVVMRCDRPMPQGTIGYADIARAIDAGKNPEDVLVEDVAEASHTTIAAETALVAAAHLMREQGVQRLPVMDEQQLVGIVELADCYARGVESGPIAVAGGSP